jgi:hypothetical protein
MPAVREVMPARFCGKLGAWRTKVKFGETMTLWTDASGNG